MRANDLHLTHLSEKCLLLLPIRMTGLASLCLWASLCLCGLSANAEVHVFVTDSNGVAWIQYACSAGEVVRSFALDVTVDQGQIIGVSNYFTGLSTAQAQGYGIFPAAFRDHVTVTSGSNATWNASGYSPLAAAADAPSGTQPGLGSSGVTLEFGALWDPTVVAAIPPSNGTLCSLAMTQPAHVSITPNSTRGSIIASPPTEAITPIFTGAMVGPAIKNISYGGGNIMVLFQDGEMETAPSLSGPWTGTGNRTGTYSEPIGGSLTRFYRVHNH